MKKSVWIFLASTLALPARAFAATVQIDFTVNPANVPLSPWLTGLIALILAFAGIAFLRRRGGLGMFIAAFAVVLGGLSVPQVTHALLPAVFVLDVSPKIVPFMCPLSAPYPTFMFQGGGGPGGVTITNVMIMGGTPLKPTAAAVAPAAPASTASSPNVVMMAPACAIGTILRDSDTCEVDTSLFCTPNN